MIARGDIIARGDPPRSGGRAFLDSRAAVGARSLMRGGGIVRCDARYNPPVAFGDSPLYTRGPLSGFFFSFFAFGGFGSTASP